MNRAWAVVGWLLLAGCDDEAGVRYPCGRQCEAAERCDLSLGKCVLNGAPSVTFTSPLEDEVITAPVVLVAGRLFDDAFEFLTPEVSFDDGATWQELAVDPEGDFSQRYDVPALDGQNVNALVRVKDSLEVEGRGTRRFSVDRVAPRCRVAAPGPAEVLTGASAQLTLEVLDGSRRYGTAELSLDNGVTWQTAPLADAQAQFTFPLPEVNGVTRAIQLRATDAAGNRCTIASELTIDTVGPEVTPVAPLPAQALKASDGPVYEVRFEVNDPGGVSSAEVLMPPSTLWTAAAITNGVAVVQWRLPAGDDGVPRSLQFRARDAAGNLTTSEPLPVDVDVVPPTCTLVTPVSNQVLGAAAGPRFDVTWSVNDGSQRLGAAEVSVDGVTWQPVTPSASGQAVFGWLLDPTADGTAVTVQVRGQDSAGNSCPTRNVSVTVDQVAPRVTVTEPVLGATVNAATLRFAGTVSDGTTGGITLTADFADGVGARPVGLNGSSWAVTVPTVATEDFVNHPAQLRARDAAGNERVVPWGVNVDRVAPVVTVTSPAEGQRFNASQVGAGGEVTVQVSVIEGDPLVVIERQTGPTSWTALTATSFLAPSAATDDDVEYLEQLRARDSAGNVASTTRRYRVDRLGPSVVSTTPGTGTRRNAPELSMQFSEPVVRIGTALPFTFTPAAPGTAVTTQPSGDVVRVAGLAGDESYSVLVDASRLTDVAGNPAVVGAAVTFSTVPRVPMPNTTLIPETPTRRVEWFRAAQDADGVVALAVRVIDPTTLLRSWLLGWIDPKTGLWTQQAVTPGANTGALLFTHVDATGRRTATARLGADGPSHVWTYGNLGTISSTDLLSGLPPISGTLPGSDVATLVPVPMGPPRWQEGFDYLRPPNASWFQSRNIEIGFAGFAGFSGDNFALILWNIYSGADAEPVAQQLMTCTCASLQCCSWGAQAPIGHVWRDPPLSSGQTSPYQTIGDQTFSTQLLRTADATWLSTELWGTAFTATERTVNSNLLYCTQAGGAPQTVNLFPETAPYASVGTVAMTRTAGDTEIMVAASSASYPRVPGQGFVRLRRMSCPPTPAQLSAYTELSLPSFQAPPGSYDSPPIAAPVAGIRPGALYVIAPGALHYVE